MTQNDLRSKYGYATIMGIDADIVAGILPDGYTCRKDAIALYDGVYYPLASVIQSRLQPKLRYEAEVDITFLQVIPYAVIEQKSSGKVFAMKRIGGDERLIGQLSIGVGGHIDEGEIVLDALYREIEEEIGLTRDDFSDITFCGYVSLSQTEVDKVHLGMIYHLFTEIEDIRCLEPDKLEGRWMDTAELRRCCDDGLLESWSALILDPVVGGGE